jgi:hypothetical protein
LPGGSKPQTDGRNRAIQGASSLNSLITQLRDILVNLRRIRLETAARKNIVFEDRSGNLVEVVRFRRESPVAH